MGINVETLSLHFTSSISIYKLDLFIYAKAGVVWEFCNALILYSIDFALRMQEHCTEMNIIFVLECPGILKYFHESSNCSLVSQIFSYFKTANM